MIVAAWCMSPCTSPPTSSFTKNGAHFAQPWVLMHMRDMLAFFTSGKPLQIVAYRLQSK